MTHISYHVNLNEVQEQREIAALLDAPLAKGPFDRLAWFRALAEDGGVAPLLAVAQGEGALVVLPLSQAGDGLQALSNWYAFTVRPVWPQGTPEAMVLALLTALGRDLKSRAGRLTLSPVPDEGGEARLLARALRAAGWFVESAVCDTNHYLDVAGRSFADYLAARPGPLRTTLKRKAKKVTVHLHDVFSDAAWADYEAVYAQSWKPEEGAPAMLRRFAAEEGAAGRLRLGLAYAEGAPVAAQLWSVENAVAYIHKLAYTEASKALSPGTTLSAALFERVIDGDRVETVDFGTGDDPYKRDWMESSRPRHRLAAHNPAAPREWVPISKALIRKYMKTEET